MNTIQSVTPHLMSAPVLSMVTVKYYDGINHSVSEEYGTIEALCRKYDIIERENNVFEVGHLIGRKCMVSIENGATVFIGYLI